jgi:hypothetical protein
MGYTNDIWWEQPEFVQATAELAARFEEDKVKVKDERTKQVEKIAKEWGKREYFRQKMAGAIAANVSEADYIKSVWERAMHEGDIKYRQSKGEKIDDVEELADFKSQQERKAAVMLKRAKQEMKEILEAEDLVSEDLKVILEDNDEPMNTDKE